MARLGARGREGAQARAFDLSKEKQSSHLTSLMPFASCVKISIGSTSYFDVLTCRLVIHCPFTVLKLDTGGGRIEGRQVSEADMAADRVEGANFQNYTKCDTKSTFIKIWIF